MPKISVIVPIYNAEKNLHRCIDSILAQTYTDFELLLINDGSADSSGAICDEYAQKDTRIRVFHKENGGSSSARNMGLNNAIGEWVTYCDSDDWIEPTMYEEMYECANKNISDVVYCDINMVYRKSNERYNAALYSTKKNELIRNYITSVWTSLCNVLVKLEIYRKYNLYSPEHLRYCEDFWLSVRLFHYANKISYVAKAFYNYNRINEVSVMHSLDSKTEQEERMAYLETIEFFNKEGVGQDYKKEMAWRILKSTHDSIYHNRYNEFLSIYPEAHPYIWSCPYINVKTKLLLWMLTHRMKALAVFIINFRNLIRK